LNASLPSGFIASPSAVDVESIAEPELAEDGTVHWTIRAERTIYQQVNVAQVTHLIQGLGASEAQSRLDKTLPSSSDPRVSLSPSWWPWVPIVPFRIEVVTQ